MKDAHTDGHIAMAGSLGELFECSVRRWPGRPCIVDGAVSWTYAQVAERVNALRGLLAAAGVRRGDRVGLILERSAQIPFAILAVTGLGAAYVPLDPDYPDERLHFMTADADLRYVVGDPEAARRLGRDDMVVIDPAQEPHADSAAPMSAEPTDPAYVIYTSGSTGQPKGCVVSHQNVLSLLRGALPLFSFGPDNRWSLFHSAAFDFSVWELWGALATGASAVVVPAHCARMPNEFHGLLRDYRITVLNQVPSVFRALNTVHVECGRPSLHLRYLVFGGESVELDVVAGFLEGLEDPPVVVNMYGITEITVHATFKELTAEDLVGLARSPIGVPLPHLEIQILDAEGQPVREGQVGEMWVAGDAVATGYLNRPELTAQRFATRSTSCGDRWAYRTGDLARRLSNGELQYEGRCDQQIKLRGFRIEPGEIEAVLRAHEDIRDVAVTVVTTPAGAQFLIACVVRTETAPDDARGLAQTLRAHAREKLPSHMVPDRYIPVPALPLTASGKLDRAALDSLARSRPRAAPAR